jgi:hypothetical protein
MPPRLTRKHTCRIKRFRTPTAMLCALYTITQAAQDVGAQERISLWLGQGASFDRGGFAQSIGIRLQLGADWITGLTLEQNRWVSLAPFRIRAGALNYYATLARRFALSADNLSLRTTVHLGLSTSITELVGVPAGSTGAFVGANLLGLEWRMTRNVTVIVDPADVAIAAPQLRGVPFVYLQYRLTLGTELRF